MKRSRGSALILAIFFMAMASFLTMAYLVLVPTELTAANRLKRDLQAGLIADAGIRDTMAWMAFELNASREPCTPADPTPLREGDIGEWHWAVRITPDPQTPPNGASGMRMYQLTSTASRNGQDIRRIDTWVQGGESFAKYSFFTDLSDPGLWDYLVVPNAPTLQGPVHHNGVIKMYITSSFFTGPAPAQAAFQGKLTGAAFYGSSPDGVRYASAAQAPYSYADGYDRLLSGGVSDLQVGVSPIPMPGDATKQARAAWGGTLPASPPPGITLNPGGGVFVNGNVTEMLLSVDGLGRSVTSINLGGVITTITEDTAANQTIVQTGATVTTTPGVPNGVIYATGNIDSLRGTNKGDKTIAVDIAAGCDIEITGDLLRADTAPGTPPASTDDRLGLVCQTLRITDNTALVPRNMSDPLYLYATMYCSDRLAVESYNSGAPGQMAIFGGLIERSTWRLGTFNTSTGNINTGIGGLGGVGTPNIFYDAALAGEPPPHFPTSGSGKLLIRSWREQNLAQ